MHACWSEKPKGKIPLGRLIRRCKNYMNVLIVSTNMLGTI
jgi:hypothetical protein